MARVLHVVPRVQGHLRPQLAIAGCMAQRGHEVYVTATPQSAGSVIRAGLQVAPLERLQAMDDRLARLNLDHGPRPENLLRWLDRFLGGDEFEAEIHDVADLVASIRPDLVVYDQWLGGSQFIVPELSQTPAAIVAITLFCPFSPPLVSTLAALASDPSYVEAVAWQRVRAAVELAYVTKANAWRRRHGLGLIPRGARWYYEHAAEVFLVLGTEEFDGPRRDLPENLRYVGPCLHSDAQPDDLAKWRELLEAEERPIVCVSTSSFHLHGSSRSAFLDCCAEALGDLPVRVLASSGGAPVENVPLPLNMTVFPWIPHQVVLEHSAALVCNGGASTLGEAVRAGVPLVVVPLHSDQAENSWRVQQRGLGRGLPFLQMTPARLRAAVLSVLDDSEVGARVGDMALHFRAAGGADRAADFLEQALPGFFWDNDGRPADTVRFEQRSA